MNLIQCYDEMEHIKIRINTNIAQLVMNLIQCYDEMEHIKSEKYIIKKKDH